MPVLSLRFIVVIPINNRNNVNKQVLKIKHKHQCILAVNGVRSL